MDLGYFLFVDIWLDINLLF